MVWVQCCGEKSGQTWRGVGSVGGDGGVAVAWVVLVGSVSVGSGGDGGQVTRKGERPGARWGHGGSPKLLRRRGQEETLTWGSVTARRPTNCRRRSTAPSALAAALAASAPLLLLVLASLSAAPAPSPPTLRVAMGARSGDDYVRGKPRAPSCGGGSGRPGRAAPHPAVQRRRGGSLTWAGSHPGPPRPPPSPLWPAVGGRREGTGGASQVAVALSRWLWGGRWGGRSMVREAGALRPALPLLVQLLRLSAATTQASLGTESRVTAAQRDTHGLGSDSSPTPYRVSRVKSKLLGGAAAGAWRRRRWWRQPCGASRQEGETSKGRVLLRRRR
ncbi:hypothetical protein E2C01_089011 [Portunus trituberculatus]|uniref:Uncharacterized protein n=1 Tax=Portunus trituberculatus TaxID=210409 RepID=A0A5B7JHY8_PORTR|nr:hypothetical protein [Portunus trituberculatus]